METTFWLSFGIVFYTYIGYAVLIFFIIKVRGSKVKNKVYTENDTYEWPEITHIIAAYNEEDYIVDKIQNSLSLDYPADKLEIWVVADGSTDKTPELAESFNKVSLFYEKERKGKIHAINRVMSKVKTPIVVYSDANTILNKSSLKNLVRHYRDEQVGCVSGEKRIRQQGAQEASSAGEGIYWQYESFLKKYDYALYSVVGAAGELFSIRTALYNPVPRDTIIEDFYLSLKIAEKGYKIAYEPEAYALEYASASIRDESKRKTRIAAGGFQAMGRLLALLNPFSYGWLSFQYFSHRVMRWTLAPLGLLTLMLSNAFITHKLFYVIIFYGQVVFYFMAIVGYLLQKNQIKLKLVFIPFYFTFMNLCVFQGFVRYLKGQQSVLWERASRKTS